MANSRVKVGIDARIVPGTAGGVETVILGLAEGFSQIQLPHLDLCWVTLAGHSSWIGDRLGAGQHVVEVVEARPPIPRSLTRAIGPLASPLRRVRDRVRTSRQTVPPDREIEALGFDVVHFTDQFPGMVSRPFIYQPHDLQHLHLPEFFSKEQIAHRNLFYGVLSKRAASVCVGTSWVKDDIVRRLGVEGSRVQVIPLAPVSGALSGPAPTGLPTSYVLYPAAGWPHKNHERLLVAVASLVDSLPDLHLVLTGATVGNPVDVAGIARKLKIADRVHLLGYLPPDELVSVFTAARAVVVPTLFESASFPIWEAFQRGVPVACSNVTALPRQVGDAALIFDPTDADDIARAIARLWSEPALRKGLIRKGAARVAEFSWADTANRFAALYRTIGGVASSTDMELLEEDPKI